MALGGRWGHTMTQRPQGRLGTWWEDGAMDVVPASLDSAIAAALPVIEPDVLPDDGVIVDLRDPADFAAGHAPGAVNIPLTQLTARLDEVRALTAAAGGSVAVSCGGGTKQGRATAYLRANGVDAAVLRGGMRGWKAGGRPIVDN